METGNKQAMSRRGFFQKVGVTGVAAIATGSALTALPRSASAAVDSIVADKLGAGSVTMAKVNIDTPSSADNGALVRMPVSVDHPMEPGNYIESVVVLVDNNPQPFICQYDFLPEAGKAEFECRIKMAKTSKVRAIAKSNSGKLYGFEKEIQVAAGGCVG
ncbi:MAG: thiosulfate oxidation carrier protein SoxY [Magnetococcales bacterium]|nr:thiosulfate oxidation carrier protein SoxY [Magnetococcales bacterium]